MNTRKHWQAEWKTEVGRLLLCEPFAKEIGASAAALAAYYSEDHNRTMMAHSGVMSAAEVVAHYQSMEADGNRPFLLYRDDRLVGDADVRRIRQEDAECAIMVGERALQGQGIGTRFAVMMHALAFDVLSLVRLYVSIIPINKGSRRLFEKVGYHLDNSPAARSYADYESDITMSFTRTEFCSAHAAAVREIVLRERVVS
jgi:RimJ/RimL family protein N-acetyltransferase